MNLNEKFEQGLPKDAYLALLDQHKEGVQTIYSQFSLPAKDSETLKAIKAQNLRAVILAEPWCGHCMMTVPVFLHLAEATGIESRFLLRDDNLDLMDQHLTNGKSRSIPIYLFINEAGELVHKWGPIAETTKAFVAPLREKLPEKDDPAFKEAFKLFVQDMSASFASTPALWEGTYTSMKEALLS